MTLVPAGIRTLDTRIVSQVKEPLYHDTSTFIPYRCSSSYSSDNFSELHFVKRIKGLGVRGAIGFQFKLRLGLGVVFGPRLKFGIQLVWDIVKGAFLPEQVTNNRLNHTTRVPLRECKPLSCALY